jgi:sugar/nucleoside kinase (ribokinase family)
MSRILVSGLINMETTLRVDGFPIEYVPARYPFFGIKSGVSGVGFNLALALSGLGDSVQLLALVGDDLPGQAARARLAGMQIDTQNVLPALEHTPQSVILYDVAGRRQVNTDLKDLQQCAYPLDRFDQALAGCDLAALTNINFSRPLLGRARVAGVPIACDVHAISQIDDPYNADFMRYAEILFMSHEQLPLEPDAWLAKVMHEYAPRIAVVGLGEAGALLAVRGETACYHAPARHTRPIVSTVGAGDALFSCFLHVYVKTSDPFEALRMATVFASYKIGSAGGAEGLLDDPSLRNLCARGEDLGRPQPRNTAAT